MGNILREKIEAIIKNHNISIHKWCTDAGVTDGAVRSLLKGRTNSLQFSTVEKLAHAVEMEPYQLLGNQNIEIDVENEKPVAIDYEIYELAKEVAIDAMRDQDLSFTEEELLDHVIRAYEIGLEIKSNGGDIKPANLAARWAREL